MHIKNFSEYVNESISQSVQSRFIKDGEELKEINSVDEISELLTKFEKFKIGEYLVIPGNGTKPTCMIVKDAPRSKYGYKIEQNYYYPSVERMVKSVVDFFESRIRWKQERSKEQEEKKKQRQVGLENINDLIQVGDIFYSSWGYEQTNVDFYQVVDVSQRGTVSLKEIGAETVEGSEGRDCANVRPVKDKFVNDEIIKKRATFSGKNVYLGSGYRSMSKYDMGDRGVYCSWYY